MNTTEKKSIEKVIEQSKEKQGVLQFNSSVFDWTDEGYRLCKRYSSAILPSIKIIKKIENPKVENYIDVIYPDMNIYIQYKLNQPQSNIIIKIDDNYYLASSNKGKVNNLTNWMIRQVPPKP